MNPYKISALLGKIDTHEYLTGKQLILSNQSQIIEQLKFTYFQQGKELTKDKKEIMLMLDLMQSMVVKLKELGNFDEKLISETKNYDDNIHEIIKFEFVLIMSLVLMILICRKNF